MIHAIIEELLTLTAYQVIDICQSLPDLSKLVRNQKSV